MDHKLLPEVATRILDSIRHGVGRMEAAKSAGVSGRSMRRWMQVGLENPSSHLGIFRSAVLEAEGTRGKERLPTRHIKPEVQAELTKVLRFGNFRVTAARYAEVNPRTLKRWMQLGKSRPGSEYESLRNAVLKAEQEAEIGCVAQVILGAQGDARHAEWWLIRRHGERWKMLLAAEPGQAAPVPSALIDGIPPAYLADPELRRRWDSVAERVAELDAASAPSTTGPAV